MLSITIHDQTALTAFWLVFSRWLAVFIQLPIVEGRSTSQMLNVLTCLVISYALYPHLQNQLIAEIHAMGPNHFWILTIFHVGVGLLMGLIVKCILDIFVSSGIIISQQIGFSAMRYFDPGYSQPVGPFEKIMVQTILLMVLFSGALIPMFKGVYLSFFSISVLSFAKLQNVHVFFFEFFKGIFTSSILLSTPLLFTNILISFIMGILSRTVPQMNVLMVSFIINIALGTFVFILTSNEFFQLGFRMYTEYLGKWFQFVQ